MTALRLGSFLICTFLLINLAYADNVVAPAPAAADEQTVDVTSDLKIVAVQKHEENAEPAYEIDTNYPQLTGKLSPAAENFNRSVLKLVEGSVQQFKNYVKSDQIHMQTLPEAQRQNSLQIDYDVDVIAPANHPVISVRLNIEGMQAGRAHPYHAHQVLNFDLQKNKALALSDLFKPRTNYLGLLAKFCDAKLNNSLQDKWMVKEGTAPAEKNYKNWNIEADGILITFDEYQVAPYADGVQEVEIPFSVLHSEKTLAKNSVLAPCVADAYSCIVDN